MNEDFLLWINYHLGNINYDDLSSSSKLEIQISDFAMHLLVPKEELYRQIGGEQNLNKAINDDEILCNLSNYFVVDKMVIFIKILSLLKETKRNYDIEKDIVRCMK